MLRVVFLLLFFVIVRSTVPSSVFAQSPPVVSPPAQNQNPLEAIWNFLTNQNTNYMDPYVEGNLPPKLEPTNKADLQNTEVSAVEDDVKQDTARNYGLSRAIKTSVPAKTDTSWIQDILLTLGFDIYADKAGQEFAGSILPSMPDCTAATCFQMTRCAGLPPGSGDCETSGVAVVAPSTQPGGSIVPTVPAGRPSPTGTLPIAHATYCPTGSFTYYSQRDPAYANIAIDGMTDAYGQLQQCNVLMGGCGPVAMSMILSCYLSPRNTPDVVIGEHYNTLTACYTDIFQHIHLLNTLFDRNSPLRTTGVFFEDQSMNSELLRQFRAYIEGGSSLLVVADINTVGHFFWVTDITEDGTIYVMDPYYGHLQPVPMDQAVLRSKDGTGPARIIYKSAVAIRYDENLF